MLGYVRIEKGELKVKEYELYRGLYCSLCKTLGREYGQLMRMILSYDVTFLVLVLLSVRNIAPKFKKGVCPFNFTKRCNYCTNAESEFSYAAAVSVMMFYFKVKDNISDGSFFRRVLMKLIHPFAKHKFKKAVKKYPDIAFELSVLMSEQAETEQRNTGDIDEAADASAKALGKIFTFENNNDNLYSFAYALGRWVYLTDAADDIKKDLKTKNYNVFVNCFGIKSEDDYTDEVRQQIIGMLNMSIAPATDYCNKMKLNGLCSIIENVLYYGTETVMNKILKDNLKDD